MSKFINSAGMKRKGENGGGKNKAQVKKKDENRWKMKEEKRGKGDRRVETRRKKIKRWWGEERKRDGYAR